MRTLLTITILMLFSPMTLAASPATLLQCLGKEEQIIHQNKLEGPVYALNKSFINELSSLDQVPLLPGKLEKICHYKSSFSPSVNLLYELLLEGTKIFDIRNKASKGNEQKMLINKMAIESLEAMVPQIFFNYLSSLQGMAKDPKCLAREIPEIKFFIDRYKNLESNLEQDALLTEKEKIRTIFEKLQGFDQILARCKKIKKNN